MATIKQRGMLTSISIFLALIVFAFPAREVSGDALFTGGSANADTGQELFLREVDEPEELDRFLDALLDGDESAREVEVVKALNPVVVLSRDIKERTQAVKAVLGNSFREIKSVAVLNDNQWPFALVGLLFLMLMMRFRRRARKNRFS